jgi:hypothetical protein
MSTIWERSKTKLRSWYFYNIEAKRTWLILKILKIAANRSLLIQELKKIEVKRTRLIPEIGKIEQRRYFKNFYRAQESIPGD